jgi:hypothetical protein
MIPLNDPLHYQCLPKLLITLTVIAGQQALN